ncbi:hypothetical protein [Bartonella tamiae]|uniref:Uncharacterized protein n=1 Tax=Bartonella tamiae Th239 TaxID=1094558 RepID=J0ZPZ1_9HYPH|nr:hypothetical protein [Bartonella tamiae]EJF90678.1 hypothetical protein ME5_01079 [Bartonella tamiae Th239]EJF93945.1 hypothetical protein MEG_00803 [Bartonella tamiae Th307]
MKKNRGSDTAIRIFAVNIFGKNNQNKTAKQMVDKTKTLSAAKAMCFEAIKDDIICVLPTQYVVIKPKNTAQNSVISRS